MIVVAGVVAVAIAALALQQRSSVPMVVERQSVPAKLNVKDGATDSIAKTRKHRKRGKRKAKATKAQKPKPTPKPRDYFTSPENE
jgi:hypothetical protein